MPIPAIRAQSRCATVETISYRALAVTLHSLPSIPQIGYSLIRFFVVFLSYAGVLRSLRESVTSCHRGF